MALTPLEQLNDEIRSIVYQLRRELASSDIAPIDNGAPISDEQVERIRDLIFGRLGLVEQDRSAIVDPDWVKRYNQAIDDGNQELAMRIIVDKEGVPDDPGNVSRWIATGKRNEYCEMEYRPNDQDYFGDSDRMAAILWYLNYVFFLQNKNTWSPLQMVEERKKRKTILPKTSPYYFRPETKYPWERQDVTDRFARYYEQRVLIPIQIREGLFVRTGLNIRVHQDLIDQPVLMRIDGEDGNVSVILATATDAEVYENVSSPLDLATKMSASAIGEPEIVDQYSLSPIISSPVRSYRRRELQVTLEQDAVFVLAYYGDYATRPAWVTLDVAPERRIKLSGWEALYEQWKECYPDARTTLMNILFLRPLNKIYDLKTDLLKIYQPQLFAHPPLVREGSVPEDVMERMVQIVREDDRVTGTFMRLMSDIQTYIEDVSTRMSVQIPATYDLMRDVLAGRENVLFDKKKEAFVDVYSLPKYWDLQKVAWNVFRDTDLWKDIADFNDIGNPLDEVEMFEGRKLALPRTAGSKIRLKGE